MSLDDDVPIPTLLRLAGREPHTWVNESGGRSEVLWAIVPAAWSGSA